jgi:hypothetical protein
MAAAPGHARAMIHRGAIFGRDHLRLAGSGHSDASDGNPKGECLPVLRAVIETAIDQEILFEAVDDVRGVIHQMVPLAFEAEAAFAQHCELLARCCKLEILRSVAGLIVSEAGIKQRRNRGRWTMEDLNLLSDRIDSMFAADAASDETCGYAPGAAR